MNTHARRQVVLAVICLSNFIASIDLTIVNVALPTFSTALKASNAQLQWIVDSYALTAAGLLLAAGNLGDRYGRRGWLSIGLLVVAASSASAATVQSADALIAARAVMGIGAAIILPTTLALVTNIFVDATERARAIGIWSAVMGLGVIAGPILGGWLIDKFAVGSIFWINVPIALIAVVGANMFVETSRNPDRLPVDVPGLLVSAIGITVLTYTIIEAPNIGWFTWKTVVGVAISAILLSAFVWWERRTWHPILDLSIFGSRRFSGGSVAVTAAYLSMCGFIFVATQYMQFITAYSAFDTGVRLVPLAATYAGVSIVAPRVVERLGTTAVVTAGLMIFATGVAATGSFDDRTPYWAIGAAMASLGCGLGFTMAPASEAIMGSLSLADAGVGSAVTGVARQLGGCFGVALIGSIFASVYSHSLENNPALYGINPTTLATMRKSMAGARHVLEQTPAAPQIRHAVESAFLESMLVACLACAAFAVAGAIVVAFMLPARAQSTEHSETAAPATAGPGSA